MPRRAVAVLGGTFDHLHRGHEALLTSAFRAGEEVAIGVTTDAYLAAHGKPDAERIEPYATRARRLRRWLRLRFPGRRWRTVPLEDRFGRSVGPGVDVLVVSADTLGGGKAVNAERLRRGLGRIPILVVPLVLADDLRPISSRRIRSGEIDRDGHRTGPISVGLATDDSAEFQEAVRGVRAAFPRSRVVRVSLPGSGPSEGRLTRGARAAARGRDLGVAVVRRAGRPPRIALAAGSLVLSPRPVRGALAAAVRDVLRPRVGRKGFG